MELACHYGTHAQQEFCCISQQFQRRAKHKFREPTEPEATELTLGKIHHLFGLPGEQSFTPTPTLKWRIHHDRQEKWSWLVGDDLFIPAQNRGYDVGDYVWTEAARKWKSGTRATFGVYYITAKVVGAKQKLGGQFAFEQPLNSRASLAADWFTGASSIGYLTPGVILKVNRQLTWYGTYQLGNHGLSSGNHQFVFEPGWNFN